MGYGIVLESYRRAIAVHEPIIKIYSMYRWRRENP